MTLRLRYAVIFGKKTVGSFGEWNVSLTQEQERAYTLAKQSGMAPEKVAALSAVYEKAVSEIERYEIQSFLLEEDEYVLECLGENEVERERLNALVRQKDDHALRFFGLEDATEQELRLWNAWDLDRLPLVKEFEEDFHPKNPFSERYSLYIDVLDTEERTNESR